MKPSHLQAIAASVVLATSLVLAACGGGGGGGSSTITVSGTVVDDTGAGVSSANVVLDGDVASLVTTAADGAFSFAKVSPPYTLTVKSGTTIVEYRALSRAAPQIVLGNQGVLHGSQLSGNVTGATFPLAAGQAILIGATNRVLTSAFASKTTGAYSAQEFVWTGASSVTTDLVALQAVATGPLITGYLKTGKRTGVTLQDGVNQSGLDIALTTPVTTTTTLLDYSLGAFTGSPHAGYMFLESGGAQFFLGSVSVVIPSGTNMVLPDGGGSFLVSGEAADGSRAVRIGTAVLGGTTSLDLPSSTVLANSLPADLATGVSKTSPLLSWTPVSGADLYVVVLSGPGLDYQLYLPAGSSTLTLPDYAALSLSLAGATLYEWNVTALKASSLTPDALTDPALGGLSLVTAYQTPDLTIYNGSQTTFTTAP